MSIRILGGLAKGFELATLNSLSTRPTSVLLKRRFFDSFQYLDGITFIDLCAGSGAIGLEALSRGASKVILIEDNPKAFNIIKANTKKMIQKYSIERKAQYHRADVLKWLNKSMELDAADEDVYLYFDPPYEKLLLYERFFEWLNDSGFKGKVIVEACSQKTMTMAKFETSFGKSQKSFKQGTSFLMVYDF